MLTFRNKLLINSAKLKFHNSLKSKEFKILYQTRNCYYKATKENKENRKRDYKSKSLYNKDPELDKKLKEIESKFLREEKEKKLYLKNSNYFKKKILIDDEISNRELLSTTEKFQKGLEKYEELYEENFDPNKKNLDTIAVSLHEEFLSSRNFKEVKLEDFKELIKDEKDKEVIEQLIQAYELEKYDSGRVPQSLSLEDIKKIKEYPPVQLNSYFNYLFLKESRKYITKKKKEINKLDTHKILSEKYKDSKKRTGLEYNSDGVPVYGKWKNSMVINLSKDIIRKEFLNNLVRSVIFGPSLVFDFDYFNVMKDQNYNSLASQISYSFSPNHLLKEPFYYNFCNYPINSEFDNVLTKFVPNIHDSKNLINITEKSYLDVFDKSKLVYLSPDAKEELKTVDPEKIYIIGALNDRGHIKNFSLEKAKKENIPAYSLPLEQYFFFKHDRVLTINAVVNILCKYRLTNCWKKSLVNNIPFRKLKTPEELKIEQENRIKKYFSKRRNFQKKMR